MSMTLSADAPLQISLLEGARGSLTRLPRTLRVLMAAWLVLAAGYETSLALQSPAQRIRYELKAAAADLHALPWTRADDRVQLAIARNLDDRAFQVDVAKFPAEVAVTLPSLDRKTCIEARTAARRIEGPVVVALDGYGSVADCRDDNTMVWRIMP
jgi:hypothetical protein